jgi:Zn finger protein HypA/HybF involved in hydrogenase expression
MAEPFSPGVRRCNDCAKSGPIRQAKGRDLMKANVGHTINGENLPETGNQHLCPGCGSPMRKKIVPNATPAIDEQPPVSPERIEPLALLECPKCHHAEGRHLKAGEAGEEDV